MVWTPLARWMRVHAYRMYRRHAFAIFLLLSSSVWTASDARAQTTSTIADLTLGTSVQGRPIEAVRIGSGQRKLVLVGDAHGGPEHNTHALAQALSNHFRANPADVPPDVRLYIIPTLNPDGLALGTRQNANGVDLNRNMRTGLDACPENDWRQRINGAYGIVSDTGGPYSESEVESRLIRDFLLDASGVIFFHTSGAVVFPACQHPPSTALGQTFAEASGYTFTPTYEPYQITGGMHDWAGGLGIVAITPELTDGELPDTEQNLAGVLAVLRDAQTLLPLPEARTIDGIEVQPVIWRAWQAWGGEAMFGRPRSAAWRTSSGWTQRFERAAFTYRLDQRDTTDVVQLDPLGQQLFGAPSPSAQPSAPTIRTATEVAVQGVFEEFRQMHGGAMLFGKPLRGEEQVTAASGEPVVRQVFERVVLQRPVDTYSVDDVSLAPLAQIRRAQFTARSPYTRMIAE